MLRVVYFSAVSVCSLSSAGNQCGVGWLEEDQFALPYAGKDALLGNERGLSPAQTGIFFGIIAGASAP